MFITIKDDFNLTKIVHSGQCFRCRLLDTTTMLSAGKNGKTSQSGILKENVEDYEGNPSCTPAAGEVSSGAAATGELYPGAISAAEFISGSHRVTVRQLSDTEFEFSCTENEFNEFWFHYFDLDTDYAAIRATIAEEDSFLKTASEHGKGIRILRQDPFEMLITFVISQRKNIPAICKAVEAICRTAGTKVTEPPYPEVQLADLCEGPSCRTAGTKVTEPQYPEVQSAALCEGPSCRTTDTLSTELPVSDIQPPACCEHPSGNGQSFLTGITTDAAAPHSFYTFPDAYAMAAMTDEEWRALKLGYREKYLRRIVGSFIRGEYDLEEMAQMDDDTLRKTLTSLYGVGEKVAECVMLFGFHRLDSFPVDIWIRRALDREYPDGYGKESYSPYNGVMQQYMYYAYRSAAGLGKQTE